MAQPAPPKEWHYADGTVIACTEKVKVLEENWREAHALLQDILDDAVLMGCTVEEVKHHYKALIEALECAYRPQAVHKERESASQ